MPCVKRFPSTISRGLELVAVLKCFELHQQNHGTKSILIAFSDRRALDPLVFFLSIIVNNLNGKFRARQIAH